METMKLASVSRDSSGKGVARRLRAEGRVPAVLYGHEENPLKLWVSEQDFRRVLRVRGEMGIIDLSIEGDVKGECDAIIKEIQQHPASGKILHIDFQRIRRGEKIKIEIPVELVGEPVGVKEMGGVLEHGPRQLSIRCMPRDMIERIEIDVKPLKIHDAIHIKDVAARYPNFEFLDDLGTTLAIVVPSRVEVEAAPVTEEAAEPEVIGKGKEAEKEEGEEEPEAKAKGEARPKGEAKAKSEAKPKPKAKE
jgi:large subunit ribosomal protein L25